jgi:predicted N-formylglutamate amidohydrolase
MSGACGAAPPFRIGNAAGSGPFLIVCEHASSFIPPEFGALGLDAGALASHIARDPGALEHMDARWESASWARR